MRVNMSGRSRHWSLVLYISEKELNFLIIKYMSRIVRYAFIIHDKDTYSDDIFEDDICVHNKGDLKKEHIHLLISFHYCHTFTSVKKLFTTENDSPHVESISDMLSCFRYLTHLDDKDKYQYDSELIKSNDLTYYKELELQGIRSDRDNLAFEIVNDLLKHVSPIEMLRRYGRDYVIHREQYKSMYEEILDYKIARFEDDDSKNDNWIEQVGM